MRRPEVIVVGAGIAGVTTALELRRRGASVTLIDRWEPGHSRASSTDYNRVFRSIHGKGQAEDIIDLAMVDKHPQGNHSKCKDNDNLDGIDADKVEAMDQ